MAADRLVGRRMRMSLEDLQEHYRSSWGEPSRTARFETSGKAVEICNWQATENPEGVCLYATAGLSAYALEGHDPAHRLELFTGLLPDEERIAKPLAMVALGAALGRFRLAADHTVTFPEPFWPGSGIHTFLLRHQLAGVAPPLTLGDGMHVELLQAIPIFPSELSFKSERGAEALIGKWREARVQFWNPNRFPHPA